jgi:basic membrane protein A
MSGFTFGEAVGELQDKFPDVKFVIIDGEPTDASGASLPLGDNTLSIYFAEQEAGFLAGIAAALQTETGKVGFIGGMEIPPVVNFGWGFLAGVAYANEKYDLNVDVAGFTYSGVFDQPQTGATLAGGMYDQGIDIIFHAAGGTGSGVITEAKTRGEAGESVFVIGVDSDQFEDGVLANGTDSVILTSAIKRVDNAAYDSIDAFINGEFPGGTTIIKDAAGGGVGLPEENPNLTEDTIAKTNEALELIKSGELVIPSFGAGEESVRAWFEEFGFNPSGVSF